MFDSYKSLPLITAVSVLFLIPVSIGGFVYTQLRESNTEQQSEEQGKSKSSDLKASSIVGESNTRIVPVPKSEGGGVGQVFPDQGIPTGRYSSPPTTIQSLEEGAQSGSSSSIRNLDSNQGQVSSILDTQTSRFRDLEGSMMLDYSAPASSNNFHSQENSLVDSLEEEENYLESPASENSQKDERTPISRPFSP